MAAPTSDEPRRILDRYRLEERIAIGGTAEVWRAQDETLGRQVAVKLLHEHLLPDEASRKRIEAEARAAAGLTHPGIVDVYDIAFSDDEAAIVMELVRGRPLSEVVAKRGALPPVEAARICAQVAAALEHAHERGVVHRDVKPGNVLLAPDGRARLVDFGIARQLEENARRLTTAGTVVGTMRYMAPEQLAGEPGDQRTDVYALGATLYEMLAGGPAFDAEAPGALLEQQRRRPPPIEGVPIRLMDICWDALAPDPEARIPSAARFRSLVRSWLESPEATGLTEDAPATGVIAAAGAGPAADRPKGRASRGTTRGSGRPRAARSTTAAPSAGRPRSRPVSQDVRPLAVALVLTVAALLVIALIVSSPGGLSLGLGGGSVGGLPTKAFTASQDARVALADGSPVGAGADMTLPVGEYKGFLYRALIRFDPDWDGVGRVRKVELLLCVTDNVRVKRGPAAGVVIKRNASGDWSEGTATVPSSRNAVTWDSKPQTTDDGAVRWQVPAAARPNACSAIDLTGLYLPAVPHTIGGDGQADFGVTIQSTSDDGASADDANTVEFYSRESGERGPQLIVTYEAG